MQEFFAGRTPSVAIAAQTFGATTHEVVAPKKAPAKKVEVKKTVEEKIAVPVTTVPTSAFPSKPARPISPLPAGMPMPSGIPTPNYVAPAPTPAPVAHVNVAPVWTKEAAIEGIKAAAQGSGKADADIRALFSLVFTEQSITPGPLGQLSDADVYKFQHSFHSKINNPQHLA